MFARIRTFGLLLIASLSFFASTGSGAQQEAAETMSGPFGNAELKSPAFPVPRHVSDRAQQILRKPIDIGRAKRFPRTEEEWRAARERLAATLSAGLEERLALAPVTVEETTLGGVTVRILTPENLEPARRNKVLINLHGGAYVYFGGEASVLEAMSMAIKGYKVIAVDYRMPPEHPFPAALDDAVSVYRALLKQYAAADIGLFGASAGGGLVAATIVKARDLGLALPAAVVMNTPWSDLSKTGDSYFTLDGVDPVLPSYDGGLAEAAKLYAGEHKLTNPALSPVYADYGPGFPPSLLISGTRDLLLSCTVRLHSAIRAAGMKSDLLVFDAMWHGFGAEHEMTESKQAEAEILQFFQHHMPD